MNTVRVSVIMGVFVLSGAVPASAREPLLFTIPPFVSHGAVYVPARQFCQWLGADLRWLPEHRAARVRWQGQYKLLREEDGALAIRRDVGFLRLRDLTEAYGVPLRWHGGQIPFVEVGEYRSPHFTSIPVGWRWPAVPSGLTRDQRQIWRLLSRPGTPNKRDRSEAHDIRVVGRWASARVHPLNFVTDDLCVILVKRAGAWRVIGSGTDLSGRNYGIPARVRPQLQVPGWE